MRTVWCVVLVGCWKYVLNDIETHAYSLGMRYEYLCACRVLGDRCAALIPLRHLVSALFEPSSLDFLPASTRQDGGSVEAARLEILERLLCVREGVFVGGHP
jgi:hypothetical protein